MSKKCDREKSRKTSTNGLTNSRKWISKLVSSYFMAKNFGWRLCQLQVNTAKFSSCESRGTWKLYPLSVTCFERKPTEYGSINFMFLVTARCILKSPLLFTARIRRMTEGNVFTLSTISGGGGGYPVSGLHWGGGTPFQVWTECTPSQVWMGGTSSQVWTGVYPILLTGVGWGTPSQVQTGGTPSCWWGVPQGTPIQDWIGYPPGLRLDGVPPIQGWMGYPPPQSKAGCYVAGGVPLAFTQEDFLVSHGLTSRSRSGINENVMQIWWNWSHPENY